MHTGVDTKIVMNLGKYNMKQSTLEKGINKVLIFCICVLLVFAGISCTITDWYNDELYYKHAYIFEDADEKGLYQFRAFWTFHIILNAMIPLELVISLEIAKFLSALYIECDAQMIVPDYDVGEMTGVKA